MTKRKYSLHHLGFLWKLLLVCDCGFVFRILPKTIMTANFQDLQFTLESQSLYLENLEPNNEVIKSFLWISLIYWFRMKCLLHPGNHFFPSLSPRSLWNYPFVIFSLSRVLSTFRKRTIYLNSHWLIFTRIFDMKISKLPSLLMMKVKGNSTPCFLWNWLRYFVSIHDWRDYEARSACVGLKFELKC